MLVILYQDGCEGIAAHAEADISTAFADHIEVQTVAANAPVRSKYSCGFPIFDVGVDPGNV